MGCSGVFGSHPCKLPVPIGCYCYKDWYRVSAECCSTVILAGDGLMRIFCSTVAALKCCKSFRILGSIIDVLESHPVLAANLLRFCCWQQLKWTNVFNILSMLYTSRPICKPVGYFDVFGSQLCKTSSVCGYCCRA